MTDASRSHISAPLHAVFVLIQKYTPAKKVLHDKAGHHLWLAKDACDQAQLPNFV